MTRPDLGELNTFACATNRNNYIAVRLAAYLSGDVLEVGSGMGLVTPAFRKLSPPRRVGYLEYQRWLIRNCRAVQVWE